MKLSIFKTKRKSFFAATEKDFTVVGVLRKKSRNNGAFWIDAETQKHFRHFALSSWRPTPIKKIFSVFG